jgi:anaerobic magnesium-protoporphyrin IX monomethyl ester cyclase
MKGACFSFSLSHDRAMVMGHRYIMKILFLEIETEKPWALASVGPTFIASYIRGHGHSASLLRVKPDQEIHDIIDDIEKESPHILGFSLTTRQWLRAVNVAREIRNNMDIPIIAGGSHPTFAAPSVLESGAFDYVCIGEGEKAVCDILSCMEKGEDIRTARISNIWVKGSGPPKLRPPASVDSLPFMARDILNETHGIVHINAMRGCPFPCAFCAGGAIGRLYETREYVRRRSVNNVLMELHYIRENGPIHYVIFLDDTFTIHKGWLEEFCTVYGREIGAGFSINARADTVSPDMVSMLAQAGCKHIVYGVESGSRRVREEILNRPGDNRQFIDVFRWTKEAGIMATANYVIGIPGETHEDIAQTLALNDELAPDDFGYFVFYPYPGTPLFEICRERGYLPKNYLELPANNRQSILTLPDLTNDEIEHYYNVFAAVRDESYLRRYGSALHEALKPVAVKSLRESADPDYS